jgi:hypothetical protein
LPVPISSGRLNENNDGVWQFRQGSGSDYWLNSTIGSIAAEVIFPLPPSLVPPGCTVTNARIYVDGSIGAAHGGNVQFPPTLLFEEYEGSLGTRTYQVSQVDTTGGVLASGYDSIHFWDLPINRTFTIGDITKRWILKVIGESGTNSAASKLALYHLSISFSAP